MLPLFATGCNVTHVQKKIFVPKLRLIFLGVSTGRIFDKYHGKVKKIIYLRFRENWVLVYKKTHNLRILRQLQVTCNWRFIINNMLVSIKVYITYQ